MNASVPLLLLGIIVAAVSLLPEAFTCLASEVANRYNDDYEAELVDLTDEELEQICTSRGFELVHEVDANTGELETYTHQDYVDAASECLQIEAEL